jgi:very-short-patch-repair endonuclease
MERFKEIRAYYRDNLPAMLGEYKRTGNMHFDPYGLDFIKWETPIEERAWYAIRGQDVPMYPQIPALNYFLDFANPFLKIGLECDGKQWHDAEKDAARDARLSDAGWQIYRIPGWKCNNLMQPPWEKFAEMRGAGEEVRRDFKDSYSEKWFCETVEGLVMAIGWQHFGTVIHSNYAAAAGRTLGVHRSKV